VARDGTGPSRATTSSGKGGAPPGRVPCSLPRRAAIYSRRTGNSEKKGLHPANDTAHATTGNSLFRTDTKCAAGCARSSLATDSRAPRRRRLGSFAARTNCSGRNRWRRRAFASGLPKKSENSVDNASSSGLITPPACPISVSKPSPSAQTCLSPGPRQSAIRDLEAPLTGASSPKDRPHDGVKLLHPAPFFLVAPPQTRPPADGMALAARRRGA